MSSSNKLKIPLQEISSATNGFAEANIIGRGGYGVVYRGQSERHGMLAIKRLNRVLGQGDHEYGMEVTLLSKYKHENLVSLVGFCGEGGEKILVYNYEANQSLDKFLHSKDLSWMHRLQICMGAARGLRYLHKETGSKHVVIHRDIKSSNILLDKDWNAKISDFGLSKIALTNSPNSVIFTAPCGTMGYVDPQILYGGVTQKSDVYSFGVVLYEVLFGKLVAIPGYLGDSRFTIKMAKKHYKEKTLDKMIDPELRKEMKLYSLSTFSTIAYQCLKKRTDDRPTMSLVVEALEQAFAYQQAVISIRESFGSSSREFLYDVFISFRFDTKHIASCLLDALKREGLSTSTDVNIFPSGVLSAIKKSKSFIIIFSEKFGSKHQNLEEITEIIECVKDRGDVVIPVYWCVKPYDVRAQMWNIVKPNTNIKWIYALNRVTSISGIEESEFNRFSTVVVYEIAARIKHQLLRGKR